MAWARFDDQFYANEKTLAMSHMAFRLFVVSITYCRSQKDNCGFVSFSASKSLCGMHGVRIPVRLELQELGCWEVVNGGWLIHDFDKYVEKSSTERVRKHRELKRSEALRETLHSRSNGVSLSCARRSLPDPVPEEQEQAASITVLRETA